MEVLQKLRHYESSKLEVRQLPNNKDNNREEKKLRLEIEELKQGINNLAPKAQKNYFKSFPVNNIERSSNFKRSNNSNNESRVIPSCFNCQRKGHIAKLCRLPRVEQQPSTSQERQFQQVR